MTDDEDSAALVAWIAGGGGRGRDAEALLCRRFAPRIRLYGLRHLRDSDAAGDLVQMVLLGVLEAARAGRVREPEHLERFVLGVCRNTALRLRQKGARSQPTEDETLEKLLVAEAPAERVDTRALAKCMEQLEPRARKVVTLAFAEGRPAEEIARVLALSSGNVRVIRHRALGSLRACLDEKRDPG